MASSFTLYPSIRKYAHDGTVDFDDNDIYLAFTTSAYIPSATHKVYSDITNELAAGDGYTLGGSILNNTSVTYSEDPSTGKFDADDHVTAAITKSWRYGILYVNQTVNGIIKPLIGYILYDTTPADVVLAGVEWTTQWSEDGILTF